jgi:hypothetical protein
MRACSTDRIRGVTQVYSKPRRKAALPHDIGRLPESLGQAQADAPNHSPRTRRGSKRAIRGFKTAYGKLGQEIWTAWHRVLQLEKRRAAVPRRVPVQDAMDKPVVQLAPERKHLTNLVKMVASLSSRSPTASRVAGRGEGAGENGGSMNGVGPAS